MGGACGSRDYGTSCSRCKTAWLWGGPSRVGEIAELEAKVLELTSTTASLQALHERTMLEKKFIEDAFIRIDQQLGLGGPSETAGADDSDEVMAL